MLSTRAFRIIVIEAGGYGAISLRVVLVIQIEEQQAVNLLEQGKVSGSGHRGGINILTSHVLISLGGLEHLAGIYGIRQQTGLRFFCLLYTSDAADD